MRRRNSAPQFHFDLEIERTLQARRAELRMVEDNRACNETNPNQSRETDDVALHEGEEASSSSNEQHQPEFGTRMREIAQHLSPQDLVHFMMETFGATLDVMS